MALCGSHAPRISKICNQWSWKSRKSGTFSRLYYHQVDKSTSVFHLVIIRATRRTPFCASGAKPSRARTRQYVNMISFFFPVPDILTHVIALNVLFWAPIGRFGLIFISPIRRVHDLSYSKFSAAETFFRRDISDKNFNVRIF